jgi:hypothetical protein
MKRLNRNTLFRAAQRWRALAQLAASGDSRDEAILDLSDLAACYQSLAVHVGNFNESHGWDRNGGR